MSNLRGLVVALGVTRALVACEDPPKQVEETLPPPASAIAASSVSNAPPLSNPVTPRKTLDQCGKGPNAAFAQPGLETEVRKKLRKPDGPITLAELAKVRSLNLTQAARTQELDSCTFAHFANLRDLFLGVGDYSDLSPLVGLRNLESLSVAGASVMDASPLSKLTRLDRLDLSHTGISDVSPLAELLNLTELTLDGTSVRDVTPLAKLTKLEKLGIQHTPVKDVSALKTLKKLKILYAAGTPADEEGLTLGPLRANGTKVID